MLYLFLRLNGLLRSSCLREKSRVRLTATANILIASRFGFDRRVVTTIVRHLSFPHHSLLRSMCFRTYDRVLPLQGQGCGLASFV